MENQFRILHCGRSRAPSMPMHGLSRICIALLKSGDSTYERIAIDSIDPMLQHHQTHWNDRGEFWVSYYYNSDDCTLNVNSELMEWLARANAISPSIDYMRMAEGIAQLLLSEQRADGGWDYYSQEFRCRMGLTRDVPDLHHGATILRNMICTLRVGGLPSGLVGSMRLAVARGVDYYLKHFVVGAGHRRRVLTLLSGRPAGPVQVGELLLMLIEYARLGAHLSQACMKGYMEFLVRIQLGFVRRDGSAPSEKVLRWVNVDSVRWGNGVIMQSLSAYLAWKYGLAEAR